MQDVAIAETDHPVTLLAQPFGARPIILVLLGVAVSVDLNHQVASRATEVNDKAAKRHLPPELESVELTVAQACPETALERRLRPPELPGTI